MFLLSAIPAAAQYVPPSPPLPVPGIIDDYLRKSDPALPGLDVGVNFRVRGEDKDFAGSTHAGSNFDFFAHPPTTNSNSYWLERVMARIGYTGDWISAVVELRSSYSFSDNRYTATAPGKALTENDGPLQLEQGYVQFGNLKKSPVVVKIGRQILAYGEQRLVGPAFWLNVPHVFDAVKVRYQNSFLGADVFASRLVYTENDSFDKSNSHDTLSGLYLDFPGLSKKAVVETYLFARNVSRGIVNDDWSGVPAPFRFTAPQDLYTLGFRTKSKPGAHGPWDYGLELMLQQGDRTAVFPATTVAAARVAPRLDQNAWAFVAQGGYTWTSPLKPRLALIVSAASGDRSAADHDSQTFQNIIGSNHGLYGAMDMSGLQNLIDYRLSASLKPTAKTSIAIDLHQQYLQSTTDFWYNVAGVPRNTAGAAAGSGRGFGINPGYSPDLGRELDVVGGWNVTRGVLLEAGVGHFYRGEYVKESLRVVGSKDATYGYIQATINL
ncbi:MAG TPA: alginate export family protein [Candidatus Didemnitutus sp.]